MELRFKRKSWYSPEIDGIFGFGRVPPQRHEKNVLEFKHPTEGWMEVPTEYEYHDFH